MQTGERCLSGQENDDGEKEKRQVKDQTDRGKCEKASDATKCRIGLEEESEREGERKEETKLG
jgi:hypothetical protein